MVYPQLKDRKYEHGFQGYLCQWGIKLMVSLKGSGNEVQTSMIHQRFYISSNIFWKHDHQSNHADIQFDSIMFLPSVGSVRSQTWDIGWWCRNASMLPLGSLEIWYLNLALVFFGVLRSVKWSKRQFLAHHFLKVLWVL